MSPSHHHGHHGHHHHHGHTRHHHHHHGHHTFPRRTTHFFPSINRHPWRSRRSVVLLDDSLTDLTAIIRDDPTTTTASPVQAESAAQNDESDLWCILLLLLLFGGVFLWIILNGMTLVGVTSSMTWWKFDVMTVQNSNNTSHDDPKGHDRMTPFLKKMVLLRIAIGCIHFTSALIYWTIKLNLVREQSKLRKWKDATVAIYLLTFLLIWGISLWLLVRMLPDFQNFDRLNTTSILLIVLTAFESLAALIFGSYDAYTFCCRRDSLAVGTAYRTI